MIIFCSIGIPKDAAWADINDDQIDIFYNGDQLAFDPPNIKEMPSESDPDGESYEWVTEIPELDLGDGLIKIRSYPTNPLGGSVAKKLEAEKITYQSHFKSGVVAHNTQTDEYYIIWFPTNHYNWAFDIELVENKKTKIMYLLGNFFNFIFKFCRI